MMPARDRYHNHVRNALTKDGWTVTHDPLRLKWGIKDMYVDLGAEQLLAAEKTGQQIAVEVKSFIGTSEMADLENAIGQYLVHRSVLSPTEPGRTFYLAVHQDIFRDIFNEPLGQLLVEDHHVRFLVFDFQTEEVIKWIN